MCTGTAPLGASACSNFSVNISKQETLITVYHTLAESLGFRERTSGARVKASTRTKTKVLIIKRSEVQICNRKRFSYVQTDATTPNIIGPKMLGVVGWYWQ